MGNVVVSARSGARWRAFGTAGLGVIHPWIEGPGDQYDVGQTNPAFDVGAGVIASLGARFGLRSDVRYFRAFVDGSERKGAYFRDYGFLRAILGISFTIRKSAPG
jgi:hypothetical protein